MKLTVRQRRSLAELFADAERIVELYWDTSNGQQLSRSLESARLAFAGLECVARPSAPNDSPPRLIIEALCTICGPLDDEHAEGLSTVRRALRHSSTAGHVVILNGTADLPENREGPPTVGEMTCDNSKDAQPLNRAEPLG